MGLFTNPKGGGYWSENLEMKKGGGWIGSWMLWSLGQCPPLPNSLQCINIDINIDVKIDINIDMQSLWFHRNIICKCWFFFRLDYIVTFVGWPFTGIFSAHQALLTDPSPGGMSQKSVCAAHGWEMPQILVTHFGVSQLQLGLASGMLLSHGIHDPQMEMEIPNNWMNGFPMGFPNPQNCIIGFPMGFSIYWE